MYFLTSPQYTRLDHLVSMSAVRGGTNRLPLHTAARATVMSVSVAVADTSRSLRVRCHGAARTISSVKRSTAPAATLVGSPACLASEGGVVEAIKGASACAVNKGCVAEHGDVVEAEVPDRGVDHAVRAKGHHGADNSSSENIIPVALRLAVVPCALQTLISLPVVVFVNGKCSTDEAGSKNRCVKSDDLPHGWVVVGEDLELGVQVEVQENKASKGSGGVTRRHGFQAIVDLLTVTCADATVEHNLAVPVGNVAMNAILVAIVVCAETEICRDDGLADSEEVRAETTNEPLDKDLEYRSRDECVEQTNSGVVYIPEASGTDLNNQEHGKGNEEGHESGSPDGNDLCIVN
jgi:hypothetical protein